MRLLFRPEAVEAQSQQWLGQVLLVRPLSLRVTSWVAVAMLAAVLLLAASTSYTRKATASGVVVPDRGLIRLVPSAPAVVLDRQVVEGQTVQAGDRLFVLALDRADFDGQVRGKVQRSLVERRQSLEGALRQQQGLAAERQAAWARRLDALAAERNQLDGESALLAQRLTLAQQAHQRLESLEAAQFISSAQVQGKSEDLLAAQAAMQGLGRQRAALDRERAEIEGERRSAPFLAESAIGGITRELAALTRETAEVDAERHLVVRAPQAGTVSAVLADVGQSVSPASALASLVPAGATLQVHLYAPSSAIGFVQPGQTVRLRFESYPYQKYGHGTGRVLEVSRLPLGAAELAALALPAGGRGGADGATPSEPLFRITVALEALPPGAAAPLVAGMRLSADVLLDRRRLIEWLFEPLLGWQRRGD